MGPIIIVDLLQECPSLGYLDEYRLDRPAKLCAPEPQPSVLVPALAPVDLVAPQGDQPSSQALPALVP